MEPLFEGLVALSRVGIAHNDIKPPNIARRHDGSVRFIDFGIATQDDKDYPVLMTGSYPYHPPDLFLRDLEHKSREHLSLLKSDESVLGKWVSRIMEPYEWFLGFAAGNGQKLSLLWMNGLRAAQLFVEATREKLVRETVIRRAEQILSGGAPAEVNMEKSDVYGLGLTLLEITLKYDAATVVALPGVTEFFNLINNMTHPDQNKRFTAQEALEGYVSVKETMGCA